MQNLFANVVTRLEALEDNKLQRDSLGENFAALLAELSVLNANVKALTEVMISNLKPTQDTTQHQAKQDGEKTLASDTPDGKTIKEFPVASLSPCTKEHGSQKGNGRCEIGLQVSERTRSNTKPQFQTRSKEILRPRSPLRGVIHVQAMVPINVPSSSTKDDEDATTLEERRHGSRSPGSNGIFAPACLNLKETERPREKTTSNAQGKALAKEKTLSIENEDGREVAMGKTIPPKKVCLDGQHGSSTN